MSTKRRIYQVAERIKEEVAKALQMTADPRLSLVTITSAMVSPDLRQAKVYWVVSFTSDVDRQERIDQVDEALEQAQGHFRSLLAKLLGIRFVPHIKFFYDDTLDTSEAVEKLLNKVRLQEETYQTEPDAPEEQ